MLNVVGVFDVFVRNRIRFRSNIFSFQVLINGVERNSHDIFDDWLTEDQRKKVKDFGGRFSHDVSKFVGNNSNTWNWWLWMDFDDSQFHQTYAKVDECIRTARMKRKFLPYREPLVAAAERAAASAAAAYLHGTGRAFFTESLLADAAPAFAHRHDRRPWPFCQSRVKLLAEGWSDPCEATDVLFEVAHEDAVLASTGTEKSDADHFKWYWRTGSGLEVTMQFRALINVAGHDDM